MTPGPRWHPTLCDACEKQAVAAEQQAYRERQEQDQAVPEQNAGGWLSRLRS